MPERRTFFNILLNIILILLTILIIFWLIELIIGGSPTLDEFNFALIILIAGFIIKMYRELGEIKIGVRYSFNKTKEDINNINKNIEIIKNKLK
mgnify:CR=1 FL=1